ncbi:hypothetical protein [Asticcacaulis taihuensis]|uniref:hypothetical protein n=1 Tax=Asticcacaulis taihuensis TaxID=260084 RepID=UPI0026EE8F3D|nr:hypothetical protein [Asticcacaulis taihuensis]
MTSPYLRDLERWRELIDLVLGAATVKVIRRTAAAMKAVQMPQSEWNNRASPFPLLKASAMALQATPAGRARLKELATECLVILGDTPPQPTETTEQAWQRRADIGD